METGGNLNKIMSKKSRIKMSNFHKGKKLSQETIDKIAESQKKSVLQIPKTDKMCYNGLKEHGQENSISTTKLYK